MMATEIKSVGSRSSEARPQASEGFTFPISGNMDHPTTQLDAEAKRAPVLVLTAVFVLLVCLSLLALNVWQQLTARKNQIDEATTYSSMLSRSLAQHAEDSVEEAETVLDDMVERLESDGMAAPQLQRLQPMMKQHVAQLDQLHGLFVIDESGRWIVSSVGEIPKDNLRNDREYFQYHQHSRERGIHISPPTRSRTTGDWIIPVSRRLNHADGSFAGVVMASLYVKYFLDFYQSLNIHEQGAITLALDDGTILLRRPFDEGLLGKRIARPAGMQTGKASSTSLIVSPVDGITRIVSRSPVVQYPMVVGAALSQDEVLTDWRRNALFNAVVVLAIVLVLILLGALLYRQVQFGLNVERELRNARDRLNLANLELSELALKDGLTGLANRRHFETTLKTQLSIAQRNHTPLALIMVDIDCFKSYNDNYGHPSGDDCLRAIAGVLMRNQHRPDDLCARYGGEELVVLLPRTDHEGAMVVAERLRQAIFELGLPHAGSPFGVVTISAGVHTWQPGADSSGSPDALVEHADQALYAAKFTGRNRVVGYAELPLPDAPSPQ